jgi:NAD(P)-dependent dehydrogenase (short-subunit alcohol dehydrogenase family)
MAAKALEDKDIVYRALATYVYVSAPLSARANSICRSTPLRKVATPEDIAYQIVIVSSNVVSGHVSGQCLMVQGGMEGRLLNQREDIEI